MYIKAKQLIKQGHLISFQIMPNWKGITPALVLFFNNNNPIAIKKYYWWMYWKMLDKWNAKKGGDIHEC